MTVRRFSDCVSPEERKQRVAVIFISLIIWLAIAVVLAASMGGVLILLIPGWLVALILSGYNVRKLRAVGVTVTTKPRNRGIAGCVAAAVRGMGYPVHPRLDVARTHFKAN